MRRAEKPEVLVGDVNPLYMSNENDGSDDNGSRNRAAVEVTGDRKKNSAMNVWLD